MADVNRPEQYDLRLYSIPWCDSVPEEYRDTVSMPTFRAEDMSLAVVEARGHEKDTGGLSFHSECSTTAGYWWNTAATASPPRRCGSWWRRHSPRHPPEPGGGPPPHLRPSPSGRGAFSLTGRVWRRRLFYGTIAASNNSGPGPPWRESHVLQRGIY